MTLTRNLARRFGLRLINLPATERPDAEETYHFLGSYYPSSEAVADFEPVFPGMWRKWNGRATLSTPFRDPLLLLSYSYVRPGQTHTLVGYERVRQGNIHFAGEHCSDGFRGFIEGGARTGARAAREVLAELR